MDPADQPDPCAADPGHRGPAPAGPLPSLLDGHPLALALDATLTSIWDYDLATGLVTFDPNWARMLGGGPETRRITIRRAFALVHPDERAGALRAVQDCLAGRTERYDREYRVRSANQGWLWIHSRGRVVARDAGGRALRLIGTNTDVSARKTAELALARETDFLAALNQTTLAVLARRSKDETLAELAAKSATLLQVDSVEIALLEAGALVTVAGGGTPAPRAGQRHMRTMDCPYWEAVDRQQPVFPATPPTAPAARAASGVFPILLNGQVLGLLGVLRHGPDHALDAEEQKKGRHLAQLAALVVHNSAIYEDAVRLAEERAANLREREEQYRQVVENINQGFYTADARSLFTYCNPAIHLVTGCSPAELLGTSSFRLIAEEDRAGIIAQYRSWAAGRENHITCEFRIRVPGRGLIWVEQLTQIIRRADGRVAEFRNFLRDITDRKAATEALRESEERFRGVFDKSPIIIALLTLPEGRIVEINATAEKAFGYSLAEVRGRTSLELGLWAVPADREHYLAALKAHGHVPAYEARMRRRDGSEFTALYSGNLVTIGGRAYSLNTLQDISERKQTEEALRESEERFRILSAVAPVGIFSADAAGRCTFVNGRWCELAGLAPAQALGDGWLAALHPEDRPAVLASWAEAVRSGTPSNAEYRFLPPSGVVVHLIGQYRPQRHPDGRIAGFVGTITDITELRHAENERKLAEAQLRQAQKMESLGTLAGGVAHDFNNILTGILGHAQLALMDLTPTHPAHPSMQGILKSGARAKHLVQQILTFSRRTESARVPVLLQPVVRECAELLRSTLPAMVRLDCTADPACPPVLADATEIHQVILNLCTNAWHALPALGGVIELGLEPRVLVEGAPPRHPQLRPGPHVRLSVRDNGRGMDAATQERIFEPFFTTKEAGKGTGLGLAVVHSVVNAHGGVIFVHSTPGQGTLFEIFLPAVTAGAVPPAPPPPTTLPRGQDQAVLVVDDDPASGTVIARLIQSLGYRPTLCSDPLQALPLLERPGYALLVTDLAMPGLPGDELSRLALARWPRLPILLLSGFIEPAKLSEIRAMGVRAVLGKPPDYDELAAALQHCLPAAAVRDQP